MSEHIYLLTIGLPLATILIVFGMRYFSRIQQAKARIASDDVIRQIGELSVVVSTLREELTDTRTRLSAIEKLLKDVE